MGKAMRNWTLTILRDIIVAFANEAARVVGQVVMKAIERRGQRVIRFQ
jgi:hypothetical protein